MSKNLKAELLDTVLVENPKCMICGHGSQTRVDWLKYQRWQSGQLIQEVFPQLSAEQREVMVSGTHPYCWDKMYPKGEDDE